MKNTRETRMVFSNVKSNKKKAEEKSASKSDEIFDYNKEVVIGLKVVPELKMPKLKKNRRNEKKDEELDIPFQKDEKKAKKKMGLFKTKRVRKNKKVNVKEKQVKEKQAKSKKQVKSKKQAKQKIQYEPQKQHKQKEQIEVKNQHKVKNQIEEKNQYNLKTQYEFKNQPELPKQLIHKKKKNSKRRKLMLKITKWTTLILFLIGGIIYFLLSPIFNIKNIRISGNSKVPTETIISICGVNMDENLFKVRKSEVIKNIKQNAYIESVEISKKLSDTIEIKVQERTATFMVKLGEGYIYLNNQGYILEVSNEKLELPIISGQSTENDNLTPGNRLNKDDLTKLEVVLKIRDVAQSNDLEGQITQIDISDNNNYKIILEGQNKTAYLGDCSNLSTRILYLKAILKQEEGKAGEIFVNINLNTEYPFFREKV